MDDSVCPHCGQDGPFAELDSSNQALFDELVPREHRLGQIGKTDVVFYCLGCDNVFSFNPASRVSLPVGPLDRTAAAAYI